MAAKTDGPEMGNKAQAGVAALMNKNLTLIRARLEGKLELQLLVLQYIESVTSTVSPMKRGKSKKDFACDTEAEDDSGKAEVAIKIKDSDSLGRSGRKYQAWRKGVMYEALHYMCPKTWSWTKCPTDSHEVMRQAFESGTGVSVGCLLPSDSAATTKKLEVFQALKQAYMAKGDKFKHLTFRDSMIDWSQHGEYTVRTSINNNQVAIYVKDANTKSEREVPSEFVDAKDEGVSTKDVVGNWSWQGAYLQLKSGQFMLHQLWPRSTKVLKRRVSEDLGLAMPEMLQKGADSKQKKAEPKKKAEAKKKAAKKRKEKENNQQENDEKAEGTTRVVNKKAKLTHADSDATLVLAGPTEAPSASSADGAPPSPEDAATKQMLEEKAKQLAGDDGDAEAKKQAKAGKHAGADGDDAADDEGAEEEAENGESEEPVGDSVDDQE
jgi:hypothetical protein